ncbi:UNKNOWN [Stylonychia lemnae]|uniref:Uncharacterized protein n=1 Tax=Stylonychia lemnae TaxID=5949 RepID=A0A077ZXB9_STYLE|nr:UNKNOWN [Stylonychia lemnae]|eukprot:CDW74206.1 UNKNOWN [Stylonychia lemnae]
MLGLVYDQNRVLVLDKNLKKYFSKDLKLSINVQILARSKKVVLMLFGNLVRIVKKKQKVYNSANIQVIEKPQIIALNNYQYLMWFKNNHQIRVLNIKNFAIENIILMKKGLSYIQMSKIYGTRKSGKYEIFFRSHKSMDIYDLRLNDYPYLFLSQSIDIQSKEEFIVNTQLNSRYICNILRNMQSIQMHQTLHVIDRITLEKMVIQLDDSKSQVFLLNQRYFSDRFPLIIILSGHKLRILKDFKKQEYIDDFFNQMSELEASTIYNSNHSALYSYELSKICMLLLVRKLLDKRAQIISINLSKKLVEKILDYIQQQN